MRRKRKVRAAALLLALLLCACAAPVAETEQARPAASPPASPEAPAADPINALLQQMTLREKVGQLFMVRPDALDPALTQTQIDDERAAGVTELTGAMRAALQQYPV